jgi:hypothetical protein
MFDYCGAIHIHSIYSFDGHRTVDEIADTANRCGLDFIAITDHMSLESKKHEGRHGSALIIAGEEITPRHNHLLAFGLKTPVIVPRDEASSQKYIDEVNTQDGFGFIAHPDHPGSVNFSIKSYRWNDWAAKGYAGLAIWDLQTDWQATLTGYLSALFGYLFTPYFLRGPKKETLARWDKMNAACPELKYGIGEIDNHDLTRKYFGFKFRVFDFDFALKTIRTHVLLEKEFTGEPGADIKMVLDALKTGSSYVSNDYFRNAKGFTFSSQNGKLEIYVPGKAVIRLIKDGREILSSFSDRLDVKNPEKGVYRCEAYIKGLRLYPWIFSNPVRI